MTYDLDMKKVLDMNYRCLVLLGYAAALLNACETEGLIDAEQLKWWKESVKDISNLDKPFKEAP